MCLTMNQTTYTANIFAKRNLHPIVGGVLDNQDNCVIQCSFLLQLPVNSIIVIHEAEAQKSKMVLSCPYYKNKMI